MTEKEFNEKHKGYKISEEMQNLINEAVKSAKLTLNQYELEFNKVQKRFENYNRVQGIVSPLNTDDFFSWIALAYPDENLPIIIEVAKNPYNYKRFHEYQMRLNDISDWNDDKEFEYLQKEIAEPQQIEETTEKSDLLKIIEKHYSFFLERCPSKPNSTQILDDKDYKNLIQWTLFFYENKFTLPEISEPIKIARTNKTYIQLAFRYLFTELKQFHKTKSYPDALFNFYKSAFSNFSDDSRDNFDKVKNNDEVKRLMNIRY